MIWTPTLGFLASLPLLVAAELFVHQRKKTTVEQFTDRGLIAPEDLPRFEAAIASSMRLRNSVIIEVLLLVIAFTGGYCCGVTGWPFTWLHGMVNSP